MAADRGSQAPNATTPPSTGGVIGGVVAEAILARAQVASAISERRCPSHEVAMRRPLTVPQRRGRQAAGAPLVLGTRSLRADDGARTRDLDVGNVALYQLSYVRVRASSIQARSCAAEADS